MSDEYTPAQRQAAADLRAAHEAFKTWAVSIADALLDGDVVWTDDACDRYGIAPDDEAEFGRSIKANWTQKSQEFLGTLTPFVQEPLFDLDERIGA